MCIQEDRNQHDQIAQSDGQQCLPPVHAHGDQATSQQIRRNAVRHGNPQRGKVVRGPGATTGGRRSQVTVEQRAVRDVRREFGKCFASQKWVVNGQYLLLSLGDGVE